MFYILQLDDDWYVTHIAGEGWTTTTDMFNAARLGKYWVGELMKRFNDDLDEQGYIDMYDGIEYEKVTILEVEYNVLSQTNRQDYKVENLKNYDSIEPN